MAIFIELFLNLMNFFFHFSNEYFLDLDECSEGIVVCGGSKNSSVCVNTDGSYECRCAPGYAGNPDSTHGCVGM